MLTEPQVHLLISMSSRSIGMIHIPLVSGHNDPSEEGKKTINHIIRYIIFQGVTSNN